VKEKMFAGRGGCKKGGGKKHYLSTRNPPTRGKIKVDSVFQERQKGSGETRGQRVSKRENFRRVRKDKKKKGPRMNPSVKKKCKRRGGQDQD